MTKRFFDRTVQLFFQTLILSLAGISSPAQTATRDSLASEFTRYQLQAPQEKVFVHVDRSFYLAGEIIWFRVYGVDEYFNRPSSISRIAYVEVIGKDQKPVLQTRIDLKDGKGSGSFQVPADIATGNYTFRAYTNWMRNFSPDLYFSEPLTIVNTLAVSPDTVNRSVVFAVPAQVPHSSLLRDQPDIQFFPEGGNLVDGFPSKVAFKAVNKYGKGIYCKGFILDQKKDTLSRFETGRFGMGHFTFTPVKGEVYEAVMRIGDSLIIRNLPAAYEQGYGMTLAEAGQERLKITVRTNMPQRDPSSPFVYLFIHTRQLVKNVQLGVLANNEAVFTIDRSSLGDGISQFTVFNADKAPVCERLYFKQPVGQMRLDAQIGQSVYGTRKKVTIDLSAADRDGKPLEADLSLSVFWIDSLQPLPPTDIVTSLLLTGDLKGNIESPQTYFENSAADGEGHSGAQTAEIAEAMDNLMLTQGWTRFRWENVLKNAKSYFEFLPETDGTAISGKVIDKRTGQPATTPVTGYLSIPGKTFELSTAMSKPNGDIRFDVKRFYGNSEVIVQTNSQTDSNYRIDLASPFSENFSAFPNKDVAENGSGDWSANMASTMPAKWKSPLLYRSINAQVENTYRIAQKRRLVPLNYQDTLPFYGKPDLQYYLDDFTRFITLEEVIREYVLDVHLKEQSGKYDFRIRNSLFNVFFEDAPLVLVDGTPVFDANKIVAMDPLKIKKIDVITHRYYTNSLITDGVLSFSTYDGDLAGYPLDPNIVAVQFAGLQQQREFYAPVYDSQIKTESRVPDLRNLLVWSPEIRTDGQGKGQLTFYTSDLAGTYAMVLQGITEDGLPGSAIRTFTVTK